MGFEDSVTLTPRPTLERAGHRAELDVVPFERRSDSHVGNLQAVGSNTFRFEFSTISLQLVVYCFSVRLCIFHNLVGVQFDVVAEAFEVVEVGLAAALLEVVEPPFHTLVLAHTYVMGVRINIRIIGEISVPKPIIIQPKPTPQEL